MYTVAVQPYVAVHRQWGTFLNILLTDNTVQGDFYKYRQIRKRPLVTCRGMGRVANTSGTSVKYISLPEHVTEQRPAPSFTTSRALLSGQ